MCSNVSLDLEMEVRICCFGRCLIFPCVHLCIKAY